MEEQTSMVFIWSVARGPDEGGHVVPGGLVTCSVPQTGLGSLCTSHCALNQLAAFREVKYLKTWCEGMSGCQEGSSWRSVSFACLWSWWWVCPRWRRLMRGRVQTAACVHLGSISVRIHLAESLAVTVNSLLKSHSSTCFSLLELIVLQWELYLKATAVYRLLSEKADKVCREA